MNTKVFCNIEFIQIKILILIPYGRWLNMHFLCKIKIDNTLYTNNKCKTLSWSNSTLGALDMTDSCSIPTIPYDHNSPSGVNPEHRDIIRSWIPLHMSQKQKISERIQIYYYETIKTIKKMNKHKCCWSLKAPLCGDHVAYSRANQVLNMMTHQKILYYLPNQQIGR